MNWDSFSTGQIGSKLWLGEALHRVYTYNSIETPLQGLRIRVLAGWYCTTNFILRTQNLIPIAHVSSYDLDPTCEPLAVNVNRLWHWQAEFTATTADVNELDWNEPVDLVINTSVEHIESREWFDRIPSGTMVAIQGNDMPHDDHVHAYSSIDDFSNSWPMSESLYTGEKSFKYPTWEFTRYMKIGHR